MLPVLYAIFPPSMPNADPMTNGDMIPTIGFPTEDAKIHGVDREGQMSVLLLPEFHYTLCMLYVVGLCMLTFTG